ncbi:MAG: hypothetical protein AAF366_04115 [Pseudomonadota bacterium]
MTAATARLLHLRRLRLRTAETALARASRAVGQAERLDVNARRTVEVRAAALDRAVRHGYSAMRQAMLSALSFERFDFDVDRNRAQLEMARASAEKTAARLTEARVRQAEARVAWAQARKAVETWQVLDEDRQVAERRAERHRNDRLDGDQAEQFAVLRR